jgi:hypothetical protein
LPFEFTPGFTLPDVVICSMTANTPDAGTPATFVTVAGSVAPDGSLPNQPRPVIVFTTLVAASGTNSPDAAGTESATARAAAPLTTPAAVNTTTTAAVSNRQPRGRDTDEIAFHNGVISKAGGYTR